MPPLTGAALTGWSTPEAILLILIGLIFAAAGWTVFGLSVVLAGALAGTYLGVLAAEKFQIDFRIAVVAGALVCGLAAVLLKRVAIFFVAGICGAGFSWWGFAALYPAASETLRLVVTAVVFTASGTLAAFLLRPVIIIATAFGGGASVALGAMSLAERYAPLSLAGRWGTVHNRRERFPCRFAIRHRCSTRLGQGSQNAPRGGRRADNNPPLQKLIFGNHHRHLFGMISQTFAK